MLTTQRYLLQDGLEKIISVDRVTASPVPSEQPATTTPLRATERAEFQTSTWSNQVVESSVVPTSASQPQERLVSSDPIVLGTVVTSSQNLVDAAKPLIDQFGNWQPLVTSECELETIFGHERTLRGIRYHVQWYGLSSQLDTSEPSANVPRTFIVWFWQMQGQTPPHP